MKKIIAGSVFVLVAAAAVLLITGGFNRSPLLGRPAGPISATITVNEAGFSPSAVTMRAGEAVAFRNTGAEVHSPASNPHPAHTANPELNLGTLTPGETRAVTLTRTGRFTIHDHLNSAHEAEVIVE